MRNHSELYQTEDLIRPVVVDAHTEHHLDGKKLHAQLVADEPLGYEAMADLLREVNDAQFNIISTVVTTPEGETQWLRDATRAIPLAQRISHDAPVIEANNMLLRTLSRLRPIDFAIDKKLGGEGAAIRAEMRTEFAKLSEKILAIAQDSAKSNDAKLEEIKAAEKAFNTFLVEKLHDAHLTEGCDSAKDAENLLFRYRNLSSVLTPARTMVTLTYDETAGMLQRETQYPVTKKTPEQQEELEKLKEVLPYPGHDEKSAHTRLSVAEQQADSLFAELIASEDTALPAQARKTHLVGAKNAFIVKNELILLEEPSVLDRPDELDALRAEEENVLWLARMGSPAYVGSGESTERVRLHAGAALEQVRVTAAEKMGQEAADLKLHVTTLNTYTFLESQATIVSNIAAVTRKEGRGDDYSYLPTNDDGTFRVVDIAEGLDFGEEGRPRGSAPLAKATRLDSVSKVMRAAAKTFLSVVNCASGQDRTGTAVEKTTQDWTKERYVALGKDPTHIEEVRARGGNAAEITAHHVHGSPGMKDDSIANNYIDSHETFSEAVTRELYRKSAGTNKENKVGDVAFLKHPCARAIQAYEDNLQAFERALSAFDETHHSEKHRAFYKKGCELLAYVKETAGNDLGSLKPDHLADLTRVLSCATQTLNDVDDKDKTRKNIGELAKISQHVSGRSSAWKNVGIGLLVFACAALLCIGILAAIPSGGSSLLLTVAGAAGLSVAATAGITVGAAASAVAGAGLFAHGKEKGLAKEVSEFKAALKEITKENRSEKTDDLSEPLLEGQRSNI
ncbi:hypothetical protein [Legionella oakridgensis]|uniref:Putative esterase with patatin domain protein n=1 Tax=Legionella oakridgensis TaxID=29423 RepID=A0A0W0WX87_9GAMM|nr:hypothetical protein [Legionella oakridgensis]ETO92700.1 hypothetical protein LOR_40c04840 [Legionella oakridgensis RV-2-2007]KTD36933.1 putative esterase with patatin domain protein [Legionella oakridgensis]STY20758.1 putative esterase with patatin domain [Legionella longbeachae]